MSKAITGQETKALQSVDGHQPRSRVLVKDTAGTWRDLTDLEGFNWIRSIERARGAEMQVATATIRLVRSHYHLSLAPLMQASKLNIVGGSYSPLVKAMREVKIETASLPRGVEVSSGDWLPTFHGYMGDPDWATGELVVPCYDLGWKLQRRMIRVERDYSDSTGVAVETVMQQILDDNLGAGVVTLYTPVSPGWMIKAFTQKKEPILDALTTLARQIGWEIKYRYDSGTNSYRLTFYEPPRSKVSVDWELGPSTYLDVKRLATNSLDVRNYIEVVYSDRADPDAAGVPKRKTVTAQDSDSIEEFDEVYMGIAEAASSQIDTETEAQAMADAALADLKDPVIEQEVEAHLLPHLEEGDLITFKANGKHYDTDQTLAVTSLRDVEGPVEPDGRTQMRTYIGVRGKPSGNRAAWLEMEARPGVAPAPRFAAPPAPANVIAATTVGGAAVKFTPPPNSPWEEFELHLSEVSGFTPDDTTFQQRAKTDKFALNDLTPGTTYYAKIVPRDANGNRGTPSAEVTVTAGYVGPGDVQPLVNLATLVTNADFEAHADPLAPPDGWVAVEDVAGTLVENPAVWGDGVYTTTDAYSGTQAIVIDREKKHGIASAIFPVRADDLYAGDLPFKSTILLESGTCIIQWLDAALTPLGTSYELTLQATSADAWDRALIGGVAPAGAYYARVVLRGTGELDGAGLVTVDSVAITHASHNALHVRGMFLSRYGTNPLGAGRFAQLAITPASGDLELTHYEAGKHINIAPGTGGSARVQSARLFAGGESTFSYDSDDIPVSGLRWFDRAAAGGTRAALSGQKGIQLFTGSTSRFEMEEGGNATFNEYLNSKDVYVYAHQTGAQALNGWTKVLLAGEYFDTRGCFTNSVFTAPVDGIYQCHAVLAFGNLAVGNLMKLRIAASYGRVWSNYKRTVAVPDWIGVSAPVPLNAGQTLQLEADHDAGVLKQTTGNAWECYLVIARIPAWL